MREIKNIKQIEKEKLFSFVGNNFSNFQYLILLEYIESNNLSFVIMENSQILGIFPIYFEKEYLEKTHFKSGIFFGISLPGPIFKKDLSVKQKKKIFKECLLILNQICKKKKIEKIKINFAEIISRIEEYNLYLPILIKENFLNVSLFGQKIDLSNNIEEIYSNFSKGHKSIIKKDNSTTEFITCNDKKYDFKSFKKIVKNLIDHPSYSKHLFSLFNKNNFELFFNYKNNKLSSFGAFAVVNDTAEYFISKKLLNGESQHKLIYDSIKHYKKKNIKYLDFGVINYGSQFHYSPSLKQKNISIFKRGFKGQNYYLPIFEKYFKEKIFVKTQNKRIKDYKKENLREK